MNKSCCTTNSNNNINQIISTSAFLPIAEVNCDGDTISVKCASTNANNLSSYTLNYTPYEQQKRYFLLHIIVQIMYQYLLKKLKMKKLLKNIF